MVQRNDFPEAQRIPVNGVELEVFEAGSQHVGNPIVLCHGWPEHAYSWRYQIPALVAAGYHVIVPNQRGYGGSARPSEVADYDLTHLTGDLVGLLDYYGYDDAVFVGHDWGAFVVWGLAMLHPSRVQKIINLSLPYMIRGEKPWLAFIEEVAGEDHYFVHFNRRPGVIDAVLEEDPARFLRNLFRKNEPPREPRPGVALIHTARAETPLGTALMTEQELAVFVAAFEATGFTSSINWYRNLDRNWHVLADVDPIIQHPTLMIYGERDEIQKNDLLDQFVPQVTVHSLDCGHWIQQEMPEETTEIMLAWLAEGGGLARTNRQSYSRI